MKHYIKDKVVLITGGSSGFGLEAARLLLEEGAKVAITGRSQERLEAAKSDLGEKNLIVIQADATKSADWERVIHQVEKEFGRLDVLVNNAGAGIKITALEKMTEEEIRASLDINLVSVILGSQAACRLMKPNGKGQIINVSSVCADHAWPGWSVYSAAKAGMVLFTRCLHLEMAQWGGKASTFIPGAALTGFGKASNLDDSWKTTFPTPADFARSLVHMLDIPDHAVIEEMTFWAAEQIKKGMNPY